MPHALTIDLEDWYQLLHRRTTGELIPASAKVVPATQRLLDLLDDAGARATFFTVGMVAERYPTPARSTRDIFVFHAALLGLLIVYTPPVVLQMIIVGLTLLVVQTSTLALFINAISSFV